MEITFKTRRLEKLLNSEKNLKRKYGDDGAKTIGNRLGILRNAKTLSRVPTTKPDKMHQLKGDRDEQYAVWLVHPCRLVFEPNHDPLPRKEDGGIDLEQVTAITVLELTDYHPNSS